MAIQFQALNLQNETLFGVKLTGTVGRADNGHLQDLAEKCLKNGKLNLVLDLADVKTMGGVGAGVLAAFQQRLVAAGGQAVFVGAREVVARFLTRKFTDLPLRLFASIEDAERGFFRDGTSPEAPAQDPRPTQEPDSPPERDSAKELDSTQGRDSTQDPDAARGTDADPDATSDPESRSFCDLVPDPTRAQAPDSVPAPDPQAEGFGEVGAMGFFEDDFEDDEPDLSAVEGLVPMEERVDQTAVPASQAPQQAPGTEPQPAGEQAPAAADRGAAPRGRRRDHSYTSLSDAISALGGWSAAQQDGQFGKALENLLFSHGLAEEATMLSLRDGQFQSTDGAWKLPAECSITRQLSERGLPLTLLDIQDEDLGELERVLLEETNPDMILPVRCEGSLAAFVLLKRTGNDQEYSVVEHFALELLMRVLSGEHQGAAPAASAPAAAAPVATAAVAAPAVEPSPAVEHAAAVEEPDELEEAWQNYQPRDDSLAEVLLRLALDLPDADDRPHFWRIFGRNLWPVLPIRTLAFLGPDQRRPQVMIGQNEALPALDFSSKKLKLFFRTIERPVEVCNFPGFFKETKAALEEAGAEWVVGLKWEETFLGAAVLTLEPHFEAEDPEDLIGELFTETARLLARFDDSHENADVNLDLVRILMGQREKRMYGSDDMTQAMVAHVHRLARVMGFPPDQERDLIYGCLLRDIGLIDKDDALMGTPERMDPVQWSLFKRHPEEGARLLAELSLPRTIVDVVTHHHERFSGEGFPHGLKGNKIPLAARVVTVVENYVAMVTGTEDRLPVSPQDAARILRDNLGTRYDPDIVELFLKAVLPEYSRTPEGIVAVRSGGRSLQHQ